MNALERRRRRRRRSALCCLLHQPLAGHLLELEFAHLLALLGAQLASNHASALPRVALGKQVMHGDHIRRHFDLLFAFAFFFVVVVEAFVEDAHVRGRLVVRLVAAGAQTLRRAREAERVDSIAYLVEDAHSLHALLAAVERCLHGEAVAQQKEHKLDRLAAAAAAAACAAVGAVLLLLGVVFHFVIEIVRVVETHLEQVALDDVLESERHLHGARRRQDGHTLARHDEHEAPALVGRRGVIARHAAAPLALAVVEQIVGADALGAEALQRRLAHVGRQIVAEIERILHVHAAGVTAVARRHVEFAQLLARARLVHRCRASAEHNRLLAAARVVRVPFALGGVEVEEALEQIVEACDVDGAGRWHVQLLESEQLVEIVLECAIPAVNIVHFVFFVRETLNKSNSATRVKRSTRNEYPISTKSREN